VTQKSPKVRRGVLFLVWVLAAGFVPCYIHFDHAGWDLQAYRHAASVARAGEDPYADGLEMQPGVPAKHQRSLPYLYPPATLAVLRGMRLPVWIYWSLYAGGVLAILYVGVQFATAEERSVVRLVTPLSVYLPGLLQMDSVLGGNVAYLAYGAALLATLRGWRRQKWGTFYGVVLLASLVKAPWLTLLAIPMLSAKRQWVHATSVGVAGLAFLAAQGWIWPVEFAEWREGLRGEFVTHGFGLSPAGVVAHWRFERGLGYAVASGAVYAATVVGVLWALWMVSGWYRTGRLSLDRFGPVILTGVFLLEPRLKDYDASVLTLGMGLVLWRVTAGWPVWVRGSVWCGLVSAVNLLSANSWPSPVWNLCACCLVVGCFLGGCCDCWRQVQVQPDCERPPVLRKVLDGAAV
jgi:hypothetical protein